MSSEGDISDRAGSTTLRIVVADGQAASAPTVASIRSGNMKDVVTLFEAALAQHPHNQRLAYTLSLLLFQSDRQDEGERLLERLMTEATRSEWTKRARFLIAALRARERRWGEVIETLAQPEDGLSSISSKMEAARERLLALALLHTNRLEKLLEIKAEDFEILCLQASGLIRVNRCDEAIIAIRNAARLSQNSESAHQTLVRLLCQATHQYVSEGRWKAAAHALGEGLSLNHGYWQVLLSDGELAHAVAIICLVGGERTTAIRVWEQLQRSGQSSARIAHALLLSSVSEALSGGENESTAAFTAWQRALRNGVQLINDQFFWQDFSRRRRECYQSELSAPATFDLCGLLEEMLRKWLPPDSPLGLALSLEIASADALKQMGGLPIAESPAERYICGVQMLRQLGCTESFGRFVSQLLAEQSSHPATIRFFKSHVKSASGEASVFVLPAVEQLRRHARYFSRFGEAQVLLEQGCPAQALTVLEQVGCERCLSNLGDNNNSPEWWPRVCHQECEEFAARNPAYLALENGSHRLWHDATELTVESHLAIAQASMSATPPDVNKIVSHWREALRLSVAVMAGEKIQKTIADSVLALTNTLFEDKNLDAAIELLEGACSVCDLETRRNLEGPLAKYLNFRGIELWQRAEPDREGALRDFSRSVELNRFVPVRLMNLIQALRQRAIDVHQYDLQAAARLLLKARDEMADCLRRFSQEPEFPQLMQILKADMEQLSRLLKEDSIFRAATGDYRSELEALSLAGQLISSNSDPVALRIKLISPDETQASQKTPSISAPRIRVLDAVASEQLETVPRSTANHIRVLEGGSDKGVESDDSCLDVR